MRGRNAAAQSKGALWPLGDIDVMRSQLQRMAVFGGLLAGAFGSSAPARAPELSVLDRLEKGAWELRGRGAGGPVFNLRSEEHTSELQSLMRISYAVFCLKKKIKTTNTYH